MRGVPPVQGRAQQPFHMTLLYFALAVVVYKVIAAHFLGFSAVLAACCPPKPYPPHVNTFLALLKPVADRAERSSQTSKTWPANSQAKAHEAHDVRKRAWERDPRDRCLTQRVPLINSNLPID